MRRVILAAIATTALLTLGTAVPASAQSVAVPAGPASQQASQGAPSSIIPFSCIEQVSTNLRLNANGFERVEAIITSTCNQGVEAGITCSGRQGTLNIWGTEVYGDGGESFAACNSTFPDFDNGGYRIFINGAWVYRTKIYQA
jgi:hypothetical protein